MTNKEKALALINTFVTGGTKKRRSFLQKGIYSLTWLSAQVLMHL